MNIFITGAANGIGAAIAQLAAKGKHTVGIYDIDEVNAEALADSINQQNQHKKGKLKGKRKAKKATEPKMQAIAGKLDVSCADDWDKALAEFNQFAGGIDVLVNNAGILSSGKFTDIPLEEHLAQMQVNAKGVLLGCYKVKAYLKPHHNAKVINILSASSLHGQPDIASYAATKAYVRNITEGLDVEWADEGIRVFDVMPLYVNTNMIKDIKTASVHSMGVDHTPKDVASVVIKTIVKANKGQAVHKMVGKKTQLMYTGFKLMPDQLKRKIHLRMVLDGE